MHSPTRRILAAATLLLGTHGAEAGTTLAPWESRILQLA